MILGEIALRVTDLAAMRAFYRDVVGLEEWREGDGFVFFKVAAHVASLSRSIPVILRWPAKPALEGCTATAGALSGPSPFEARRYAARTSG